jgi:hypothetical protein
MARIVVTPDHDTDVVLMDEHVSSVHLESELSSRQVAQRLAWAVEDAEATARAEAGASFPSTSKPARAHA